MRLEEIIQEDVADTASLDLFEMANLRSHQTGVNGTIYISTRQASHGPRVKFYEGRPQEGMPHFSVSIAEDPQVVEVRSMDEHVVKAHSPEVIAWVKLNHEGLTKFWFDGTSWFADEVTKFIKSLRRLPRKRASRASDKTPV